VVPTLLVPIGIPFTKTPLFLLLIPIVIANLLAYSKVDKEIVDAKY
jgi:hypothetical protein